LDKPRAELSAAEVEELYERIERKLDRTGIMTQPKVAAQILEIVQQPDATVGDFAKVLRTDWNTSGRILKLANSAYFAQRTSVTSLERALVLLGLERVKSIALGVYLSRAAAGESAKSALSRDVWGQSVYRACLAGKLAASAGGAGVSEAFVTGLMLDCGIPLMLNVIGDEYSALYARSQGPGALYASELHELWCTHVDVASVLMRAWRIPMTLAKPIGWHHAPMPASPSNDVAVALRRIACCVGAVKPASVDEVVAQAGGSARPLGIACERIAGAVADAGNEYAAMMQLFGEIAEPVKGVEALAEAVHAQLLRTLDNLPPASITPAPHTARLRVGCNDVALERQSDGRIRATIYTASNEPLLTAVVRADECPRTLLAGLGIETPEEADLASIATAVAELKPPPGSKPAGAPQPVTAASQAA
jgi:HD-like signal output (HDOD) protein